MALRSLVVFANAVGVSSCTNSREDDLGSSSGCVIDHGGVWTYVDNRDLLALSRFVAEEHVTIGGIDDLGSTAGNATTLEDVRGGLMFDSGAFAVISGREQVTFFSAEGERTAAVGRAGEGPGEFRALSWIGLGPDDVIILWDTQLARLTSLSPDGTYRDSRFVTAETLPPPQPVGVMGDGSLVFRQGAGVRLASEQPAGVWRDTIRYLRLPAAPDSGLVTLTTALGPQLSPVRVEGAEGGSPILFAADTEGASAGGLFYHTDATTSAHIVGLNADGSVGVRVRVRIPATEVTDAMIRRERERLREVAERWRGTWRLSYETRLERATKAEVRASLAAVQEMIGGAGAELWMRLTHWAGGGPESWLVVHPFEGWARLVEVPEGHELLDVAANHMLTKWTGTMGEPYISVLSRSPVRLPSASGCTAPNRM